MKHLIIVLVTFWVSTVCVSAQNKKFDKLINEFDVIEHVKSVAQAHDVNP